MCNLKHILVCLRKLDSVARGVQSSPCMGKSATNLITEPEVGLQDSPRSPECQDFDVSAILKVST